MSDWRPDSVIVASRLCEALEAGLMGRMQEATRIVQDLLGDFPESATDWDVVGHHYAIMWALIEGLLKADPSLALGDGQILTGEFGRRTADGSLDPVGAPDELGLVAAMVPAYVNGDRDLLLNVFVEAGPKTAIGAIHIVFWITVGSLLAHATSR